MYNNVYTLTIKGGLILNMNKAQLFERLKHMRRVKELTQQQVADSANISRSMYNKIESGERSPSPRVAKAIGACLDIDWTLFYG